MKILSFRTILAIALCTRLVSAPAQDKMETRRIMFNVANIFTHEPITGARVYLLSRDSVVLDSVVASGNIYQRKGGGYFTLTSPGTYLLHAVHPDFIDGWRTVEMPRFRRYQEDEYLGLLLMQRRQWREADAVDLPEVEVKATKVKFYMDGDTLIYNADAFRLTSGSMLDALISQLPGAELKADGQIMVNGRRVDELLLNGRRFFNNDRQLMLDNLPAFMVKTVKVYEERDEMALAAQNRQVKDAVHPLVMDVGLKRKYLRGTVANGETAAGLADDRTAPWLARAFALRMTQQSFLAAYANLNNLNDNRRPGRQGDWSAQKDEQGVVTRREVGMNYEVTDRDLRFKAVGSTVASHNDDLQRSRSYTENFLAGGGQTALSGNTFERASASSRDHDLRLSTQHQLTYQVSSYASPWSFTVSPSLSLHRFSRRSAQYGGAFGSDVPVDVLDSLSTRVVTPSVRRQLLNRMWQQARRNGHDTRAAVGFHKFLRWPHFDPLWLTFQAGWTLHDSRTRQLDDYLVETRGSGEGIANSEFRFSNSEESRDDQNSERENRWYGQLSAHFWGLPQCRWTAFSLDVLAERVSRRTSRRLYLLQELAGWGDGITNSEFRFSNSEESLDAGNSPDVQLLTTRHRLMLSRTLERSWKAGSRNRRVALDVEVPLRMEREEISYWRSAADTVAARRLCFLEPKLSLTVEDAAASPIQNFKFRRGLRRAGRVALCGTCCMRLRRC